MVDIKLLKKQIKVLALFLNTNLTKKQRNTIEGVLNILGDIADRKLRVYEEWD